MDLIETHCGENNYVAICSKSSEKMVRLPGLYGQSNKAAKKAVAITKALAMNELYEELETLEDERKKDI